MNLDKTVFYSNIDSWTISYSPFIDILRVYPKVAFEKHDDVKVERIDNAEYTITSKSRELIMVQIDNAFEVLGADIDSMNRSDILTLIRNRIDNSYARP